MACAAAVPAWTCIVVLFVDNQTARDKCALTHVKQTILTVCSNHLFPLLALATLLLDDHTDVVVTTGCCHSLCFVAAVNTRLLVCCPVVPI